MEFDDAMIGALVEHKKLGKGIVLSHRDSLPSSNPGVLETVHVHWPDAEGHWKNTPEQYYELEGGHYKFCGNFFGAIKILSMPNLTDPRKTFE